MKNLIFTILFLFTSVLIIKAQQIQGTVENKEGKPLEFAQVRVPNSEYGSITDSLGQFTIQNIPPGSYKLEISLSLFVTKFIDVKVPNNKNKLSLGTITLDSDDTQLDEIVVVANRDNYVPRGLSGTIRLDEPLLEVPQNVQIINKQILHDRQITSMSDGIVANVSGATRLEHWGDSYTRINMRGSRLASFRDGMNVTSNWGPLTEDMSFVEAVEIIKGPAGFMMSNGEPSGIYNVVTKKPTGVQHGNVSFLFGSNDLYRGTLDLDGLADKKGKLLYRLNLMGQTRNSFRQYEFNKRYSIAPVVSYQLDDKTKLTAQYVFQYMKSSNTGSYYNFSANGYADLPYDFSLLEPGLSPTTVNDHSLTLNLVHEFNTNWKITAQGGYFNYKKEGESMWYGKVLQNGDMIRSVSIGDAINEMKFGQVFVNGTMETGIVKHRILAGLDMGDKHFWGDWSQKHDLDIIGSYNIYDTNYKPGNPYNGYPKFDRSRSIKERANNTQITQSYTGIYVQDELGFLQDRLRLTLAGRYTWVKDASYGTTKTDENHFSPRIGLSFSIDDFTSVYALHDQTFSPQMGLLRNGDKVKPITGNNWELGVKRSWFGGRWNTSISVYQILKNNETTADPDNTPSESYLVQVGQSKAKGVEIDLVGEIVKGLNIIANYAYTDYKVSKSIDPNRPVGMRLPGYAKHDFNVWLKYNFSQGILDGFNISVGQSALLDRSTWGGVLENGKSSLPDYFRFDAGLGWTNGNLNIILSVNNLANKYLYSGSVSGGVYYWQSEAKRNFKLGLSYNF